MMIPNNFLKNLPVNLAQEVIEKIIDSPSLRIERITSFGHTTPDNEWYDQTENEWVLVLQGGATLTLEDGTSTQLNVGDYVNIPAHCKHRVSWTKPAEPTIWLAVFYS